MQGPALTERRQISIRLDQLKRAPALSVIGLPELMGLAGAALLALMTVFEDRWLSVPGSGRLALYAEINDMIKNNGLRNTAGPSYAPLEPISSKTQGQATESAEKQGIAKWQSIYPGILVSVTVEGPYQRVRHFVRDIETNRHFLIINSVELESVRESGAALDLPTPAPRTLAGPPRVAPIRPSATVPMVTAPAGSRGSLVSLRLDLATYFQRPEVKSTPGASK